MRQSDDNKFIPMTSVESGSGKAVTSDVYYYTNQIVNIVMIGNPESGPWVLVDAGLPHSGAEIYEVANKRFNGRPPQAIILTHGHFDHVGGLVHLLSEWKVPVYAHSLEFPFLTGQQDYPEPDSSVQGGMLAKLSFIYPHEATDISENLLPLRADGKVPELPGWEWIPVPGHSPGQVALFRVEDRLLLSADAFITVKQDSIYKVLVQKEEVQGPPRYLTTDWPLAFQSVKRLQALNPMTVISGHGQVMSGEELRAGLETLVNEFQTLAVPDYGRFVD